MTIDYFHLPSRPARKQNLMKKTTQSFILRRTSHVQGVGYADAPAGLLTHSPGSSSSGGHGRRPVNRRRRRRHYHRRRRLEPPPRRRPPTTLTSSMMSFCPSLASPTWQHYLRSGAQALFAMETTRKVTRTPFIPQSRLLQFSHLF